MLIFGKSYHDIVSIYQDLQTFNLKSEQEQKDYSNKNMIRVSLDNKSFVISLNKIPIMELLKPIRNHMKCREILNIEATIKMAHDGFGLKCITITMKYDEDEYEYTGDEEIESTKIIRIYERKVYSSFYYYNHTQEGPPYYILSTESNDESLKVLSYDLYNQINQLLYLSSIRYNKNDKEKSNKKLIQYHSSYYYSISSSSESL